MKICPLLPPYYDYYLNEHDKKTAVPGALRTCMKEQCEFYVFDGWGRSIDGDTERIYICAFLKGK